MTRDLELLRRKAGQVERALNRVRTKLPNTLKTFSADFDAQDIVYRNFEIVVQNCVDMGSHAIASARWEMPKTMGDVFDILVAHRALTPHLGRWLRAMVTVRNILVHDYTRVDHRKAFRLIRNSLRVVPKFCLHLLKSE